MTGPVTNSVTRSVTPPAPKVRLATVWLDGCSGCHMSLLDTDERLIDLAKRIELVRSSLTDVRRHGR